MRRLRIFALCALLVFSACATTQAGRRDDSWLSSREGVTVAAMGAAVGLAAIVLAMIWFASNVEPVDPELFSSEPEPLGR